MWRAFKLVEFRKQNGSFRGQRRDGELQRRERELLVSEYSFCSVR